MASLSEVNKTLQDQNGTLEQTQRSLENINKNFETFFRELASEDRQDDEDAREDAQRAKTAAAAPERSSGGGVLEKIGLAGGLASAGGLLGFGKSLGLGLLARGVPGLIATTLADEIGEYLEGATGSKELGDAVERAVSIGGIGLIFGKRFALIGAAVGVLLTEENQKKLGGLGKAASDLGEKIGKMFNVELPSANKIMTGISTTFGNAITSITKLLEGDFSGALNGVDDLLLTMAGLFTLFAPGKAVSLAFKALRAPFVAASAGVMAMLGKNKTDVNTLTNQAKTSTGKTGVTKSGEKVKLNEKTGRYHNEKGKMVKAADVTKIDKKFPRLGKLLRIPGIAQAMAAYDVMGLLMAPGDMRSKVDDLAGIFGGLGGSVLGGIGGMALGTLTGPAAVVMSPILGALGGAGGYFFGDIVAKGLAQYLLGDKVDAFPGFVNDALNGAGSPGGIADIGSVAPTGGVPDYVTGRGSSIPMAAAPSTSGLKIAQSRAAGAGSSVGGGNTVIDASSSSVDASNNQTIGFGGMGTTFDLSDQMLSP